MDERTNLFNYISKKVKELDNLGKTYSDEKINLLVDKLINSKKSYQELTQIVDNKFSLEARKMNHNNHLISLKEYYLSNIDKLSNNNNCYLLSYDEGVKILEQASLKSIKELNPYLKIVNINNEKRGYQKNNDEGNDYELIISDVAYLLNLQYPKTYRIFDKDMNPIGILNEENAGPDERFLNLEETLKFIKEESPNFNLKNEISSYHDKNIKKGLTKTSTYEDIIKNLEYIFKLFKSLPDITNDNYNSLIRDYLNMLVFAIVMNNINYNLTNIGIVVDKSKLQYTYRLSLSYNTCLVKIPVADSESMICNFFIVKKQDLLSVIITNYYEYTKELLNLIHSNSDSLFSFVKTVSKEHLDYNNFNEYIDLVKNNIESLRMIMNTKKEFGTEYDISIYEKNDALYDKRIEPFVRNYSYIYEDNEEKGSALLVGIICVVLMITLFLILAVILAVSKIDM